MNYSQSQKWVLPTAQYFAACEAGQRNYSAPLQMLGIHHFLFLRVIH